MMTSRAALREEFGDPVARHDYAEIFGDSSIALQIKVLRLQRGLSQNELAELAAMKQSRISAMEQASYSGWSIRTLRRLAKAFDLALVVKFESFGSFLDEVTATDRREALERPSFSDDPEFQALPSFANGEAVIEARAGVVRYVEPSNAETLRSVADFRLFKAGRAGHLSSGAKNQYVTVQTPLGVNYG